MLLAACSLLLASFSRVSLTAASFVLTVIRQQGLLRVLQGYDASYIREVGFSVVFLGSPGLAARILGDEWKDAEGRVSRSGLLAVSVPLGMTAGFLTNSVDQLKTRIQFGQFKHLGTAFKWQAKSIAEGGNYTLHTCQPQHQRVYVDVQTFAELMRPALRDCL